MEFNVIDEAEKSRCKFRMDVIVPDCHDPAPLHSPEHRIETVQSLLPGPIIMDRFDEVPFIRALR